VIESNVRELLEKLAQSGRGARDRAIQIFDNMPGVTENWLGSVVDSFPQKVRGALVQRGALIADAVHRMSELGTRVGLNRAEEFTESSYRRLAQKLREDYKYAYLPSVLAEAGLLPGYAFPGDPGSLALALSPDVIFAGRLQSQREFCPGQTVYARGSRWAVKGLALHRPGSLGTGRGPEKFAFVECSACGLAQNTANNCRRCGSELSGANQEAWDAAAFQAWSDELSTDSEEERQQGIYDLRPHPQRDVATRAWAIGDWRLELRLQETIWWINHGPLQQREGGETSSTAEGFRMCPNCGELVKPLPVEPIKEPKRGRRQVRDAHASQDPHTRRCNGEPRQVALGHQTKADTLRLIVPGMAELGEEGVAWAWSIGSALLEGARKHFELDDDDLEVIVLTKKDTGGSNRALEILWVDKILGGSGIVGAMIREFNAVSRDAARHLEGHDCAGSCYRCLRNYRNQRVHGILNWRLAMPYLQAAAESEIAASPSGPSRPAEGPDWDEARAEGCDSPLELRLLKAIRLQTLPEPLKQHEVYSAEGRLITRADFAYTSPRRILIYSDGLEFHSRLAQRIHDGRQTNQLQNQGWLVLRFLGPEIHRNPQSCVSQIKQALENRS
jgi:hypothetical protein